MNAVEIIEIIENFFKNPKESWINYPDTMGHFFEGYFDSDELKQKLGSYKNVFSHGFYDGCDCTCVMYFSEHDVYLQLNGYYTSYEGTHWDDKIIQVYPYKKIETYYSEIKKDDEI